MKSSLFPHRSQRSRGNVAGGSAGKSSSNNRPPDGSANGYEDGSLGWRSSRQAGGESLSQKLANRPMPSDLSLGGHGGCAYDKSMARYMDDKNRPADSYAEARKKG